jgi:hypothetical protein
MLPLTGPGVHTEPDDAAQVQLAPDSAGEMALDTDVALAVGGPAFVTTSVYVIGRPGVAVPRPSLTLTPRSASVVSGSESCALLLPASGSTTVDGAVTLATFVNSPVADTDTVAFSVYVSVPPAATFTVCAILPLPDAGHDDPDDAAQLQLAFVSVPGNVSVTLAPTADAGPAFDTTSVYVTGEPGTSNVCPFVFVIPRSATGVTLVTSSSKSSVGNPSSAALVTRAVL